MGGEVEPRRVRIDLAYDGTAYAGWQLQPRDATVQGVLESALATLHGGQRMAARGAGRTDSGAHARGQVADALVATRLDDDALLTALGQILPADVRPQRVLTVPARFHARHDARSKTYRYLIDLTRRGDPFRARFAHPCPAAWDRERVDDALRLLPGRRDWSGFADSACEVEDRVRTLHEARREAAGAGLEALVFSADGFLTHMVRNLVGTLLEIGRGRFEPERIHVILEAGDRTLAGPTAPAKGLCLERVLYDEEVGGPSGRTEPLW